MSSHTELEIALSSRRDPHWNPVEGASSFSSEVTEVAICAGGDFGNLAGFRTEIHRSTTDEVGVGDRPRSSEVVAGFAGPPRYGVVRVELESVQGSGLSMYTRILVPMLVRILRNP